MRMWAIMLMVILSGKVIFAQEKQLIIQVPIQSEKSICQLQKQLSAVEGIHFSGYVKHASCILLRYNSNAISNDGIIIGLIKHSNKKMKCRIIEGYTAFDVIDGKLGVPKLYAKGK